MTVEQDNKVQKIHWYSTCCSTALNTSRSGPTDLPVLAVGSKHPDLSHSEYLSLRRPRLASVHLSAPSFSNLNRARGAYSTWLDHQGQHATRPAYISVRACTAYSLQWDICFNPLIAWNAHTVFDSKRSYRRATKIAVAPHDNEPQHEFW